MIYRIKSWIRLSETCTNRPSLPSKDGISRNKVDLTEVGSRPKIKHLLDASHLHWEEGNHLSYLLILL